MNSLTVAFIALSLAGAFGCGWNAHALSLLGSNPDTPLEQTDQIEYRSGRTTLQPSRFFITNSSSQRFSGGISTTLYFDEAEGGYVKVNYPGKSVSIITPPTEGRCCGSMYPAISNFSTIMVVPPEKEEIMVGDVIAFRCTNTTSLLHRVISITQTEDDTFYLTKGDNNKVDDFEGFGCIPTFQNISYKMVGVLY